jgi:hypothetical protein
VRSLPSRKTLSGTGAGGNPNLHFGWVGNPKMNLRHDIANTPLRRRIFGGYRHADVEVLAAHWRSAVDLLEGEVNRAKERAAELEIDLRATRTRLEGYVAREAELNKGLANAHALAQEIEDRAEANARRVVQEAEERATELRAEAFARIAATGDQIDDLLHARDALLGSVRAAVAEFDALLTRIDHGRATAPPAETPAQPSEPLVAPPVLDEQQVTAHVTAPDADRLYEGHVEVDAGPFIDFAALSSFERALARIRGVADVYVRRFVDDRATIEVTLGEPTLLVRVMAADLPFGFDVQSMDSEGLALTLHALPPLKVG